jgi:hypothetical protein
MTLHRRSHHREPLRLSAQSLVRSAIDGRDGPEREEMLAHMAWFKRRYPTPLDRPR